jgi:hypothetical protein
VVDRDGVAWSVRRTFAPWWRVAQPVNIFRDRYRGREVELPLTPTVRRARQPVDRRDVVVERSVRTAGRILSLPTRVLSRVGMAILLVPGAAIELVTQGLLGGALFVLRSLRLARHRVEVVAHTGHRTHSRTVLLVRGSRADADRLVDDLAAERGGATTPYRPKEPSAHVTVRSHDSAWQPRPPRALSRDTPKSPLYLTRDDHLAAGGSVWRKP